MGRVPFNVPPGNRDVSGDFHRPYETQKILDFSIHRGTLPQSRPLGVTAPSEREPGGGAYHSSGYSLNRGVTGDFHRPYEWRLPFNRVLAKIRGYGRFSSPLRKL